MQKRVIKKELVLTACLIVMLLSVVLSIGMPSMAYATTTSATSVLDDLRQDDKFDVGQYPSNAKDVSVYVIGLAESTDKELYIYTYQPCQRSYGLTATKVNMAASKVIEATRLYTLTLLSQEGVFGKYKVNDLVVSDKATRYYNISSIYRKWLDGTDGAVDGDNTVSEVAYAVGQVWEARTDEDYVHYDMYEEEVVTVTSQMIGFRRYYDGFKWNSNKAVDAHYMAFTCDHDIDRLLSAKVEFYTRDWKHTVGQNYKYEPKVRHTVNLYDYEVATSGESGWFGDDDKSWKRMNSTAAFVKEVDAKGEEAESLLKYDWILNFYETEIECDGTGSDTALSILFPIYIVKAIYDGCTKRGTEVSDVSLLRLEFEYDGEIYNLGVVSSTQSGSGKPTNPQEAFDLFKWLEEKTGVPKGVWIAGIVLVVLAILMPILSAVFPAFGQILATCLKVLGKGLFYLLKALWWLICLPFRGIAVLINKIKDGRG